MKRNMVRSYKELRTIIGMIGILLPFALLIGNWGFMPSISQYYYTDMRNLFVGALCAVSMFMFVYVGYDKIDSITTAIIGLFALGVAFFPCEGWTRTYHLLSAVIVFASFGYLSFFRFTKHGPQITQRKVYRNLIYRTCGALILLSLVAVIVYFLSGKNIPEFIYWAEVVMLEAFGFSWLIKGGSILGDK